MNLLFRFLWVLISSLQKPRIGLFDTSVLRFRVLPTDLDINMHMNNARYLSVMDLGRMDLLIRAGMLSAVKRNRWKPVAGSIDIKFRRPLQPLQSYQLHTRLLCWDEKWLYMEQRLESDSGLHAVATVRGLFVGREGSVPTEKVLNELNYQGESPPFPSQVVSLSSWEESNQRPS